MTCLQRNKSAAEENIVLQRIVSREITVSEYICFLTALKQVQRKALEEWNTRSLLLCLYYCLYYSVFTTLSLLLCLYYSVFTTGGGVFTAAAGHGAAAVARRARPRPSTGVL